MTTTKNPRRQQIETAEMRGADRKHQGGDRDQKANDLYPDDNELANAFRKGWNKG